MNNSQPLPLQRLQRRLLRKSIDLMQQSLFFAFFEALLFSADKDMKRQWELKKIMFLEETGGKQINSEMTHKYSKIIKWGGNRSVLVQKMCRNMLLYS